MNLSFCYEITFLTAAALLQGCARCVHENKISQSFIHITAGVRNSPNSIDMSSKALQTLDQNRADTTKTTVT